jgi:pilus assembly protein CpaB
MDVLVGRQPQRVAGRKDSKVRTNTIIMIGMAGVCGVLAIAAGRTWLEQQSDARLRAMQANVKTVSTKTLVVAAAPLRFGTEITRAHLREISWPDSATPKGAFVTIDAFFADSPKRVALGGIEENEPLLRAKVTGSGQRATLSAVIGENMKAVTIRVNDVQGVAGFILPGDHIDVMLARTKSEGAENFIDVLLQNARVLAVDQVPDDKTDKPVVVKAVTIEVSILDAQRVALAGSVGTLSLSLRAAGEPKVEPTKRVSVDDLTRLQVTAKSASDPMPTATLPATRAPASVGVIRGTKRQDYSVPSYVEN